LVTSAANPGVSSWKIRQQTGHKSDAILQRCIRDAEIFDGAGRALTPSSRPGPSRWLRICRRGVAFQTAVLIDGVRVAEPITDFGVVVTTANVYTVRSLTSTTW
jgi:hypothetical protein